VERDWLAAARPHLTEIGRAAAFEWRLAWQPRRARLALLFAFLPVLVAVVGVLLQRTGIVLTMGSDALAQILATLYLQILVVLVPLVFGTGLVAQEAEARTLVYVLVRPLTRGSLLLGKFLGSWAAACLQLGASLIVVVLLLAGSDGFATAGPWLERLPRLLVALALGTLSYGALFTLVGLVFSRPALVGLFLAFGWESAIPFLPGWIKALTVRHHLAALVPADAMPPGVLAALSPPSALAGFTWIVVAAALALATSMLLFARRDYV